MFRLKETAKNEQNVRIIRLLRAKQIKYEIAYLKCCFIVIRLIPNYVGLLTSIFSAGIEHAETRLHNT